VGDVAAQDCVALEPEDVLAAFGFPVVVGGGEGEGGVALEEPPYGDDGTTAPPRTTPARIEAST
jgi:hypothetical protein